MREFNRTDRIGRQMQRELAALIHDELRDPRVGMVTVQEVRITRDLAHAKVFFTVLGDAPDVSKTTRVLNKAAGFLRRALGQRMRLRTVPELHFVYDESIEEGEHLSALIEQAVRSDHADSS